MKIKFTNCYFQFWKRYLSIIMRTLIILFCTTVFSLTSENSFSQVKISIDQDQLATVNQVFRIIKKQTNYGFIYPKNLFKNTSKVQLEKGEIELTELLNKSLVSNSLKFEVSDDLTITIKKDNSPRPKEVIISQNIKINGVITDESNQPLPGANILEKGTTNGAQTDFDGVFSLDVTNANTTLVVSYIGFLTQEITLNNETQITIKLIEDAAQLEEIVIVGYGSVKKENLTGAVESISAKQIEKNVGTNTSQMLQGVAPNLNVTFGSGSINEEADIDIRGIGSINGGSPLILIDGVQGNLNRISPKDIASISVLKDAAAASIYGSRAAFGVILVTTKSAGRGAIKINYSTNYGWSSPTIRTDNFITDGLDWARLSDKLSLLENTSTYLGYSDEDYAYLEARRQDPTLPSVLIKTVNGAERYIHYGNTDYWNTLFWTYYIRLDIRLRELALHNLTLNYEKNTQKLQFRI